MSGNLLRLISSLAAISLLAGCTTSETFSFNKKKEETAAADPSKPVVMQGSCPQVFLREGTAIYRQYAKGTKKGPDGMADPDKLVMQTTLSQTTRQCFQTDQGLKVTVVVQARLVLGPAGQAGSSFTLPIRVAATDGDATLYSELTPYNVSLAPGETTKQFIFTKENVMLPTAGGLTRIFAGIDEGPYNTK